MFTGDSSSGFFGGYQSSAYSEATRHTGGVLNSVLNFPPQVYNGPNRVAGSSGKLSEFKKRRNIKHSNVEWCFNKKINNRSPKVRV